jgi:hypothetical protein
MLYHKPVAMMMLNLKIEGGGEKGYYKMKKNVRENRRIGGCR